MSTPTKYGPEVIDRIVEQLAEGKSLALVCREEGMPTRQCVHAWMRGSEELAGRLVEAREVGFHLRAEMAVAAARSCSDPIKGRLAFDAERWYLGKLSNAFREKPLNVGVAVSVDVGDTFDAIARVLDQAAERISSRAERTILLVDPSQARADPPAG